ncbi:hypothetical protein IFM89_010405 [Coptis chinensis]|uniref:Uncharacterized protein n=1 Tax=Coptis chinensis TaxID=261450 RepID=A0A835H7G1_9MAGN|nr:hypothetical protein IFM89_010405 [Coptis chinensis]
MEVVLLQSTSPATSDGSWRWTSPLPYILSDLAAILGLLSLTFLILACFYSKASDGGSLKDIGGEKQANWTLPPAEFEPKIVVNMAGDDEPTY